MSTHPLCHPNTHTPHLFVTKLLWRCLQPPLIFLVQALADLVLAGAKAMGAAVTDFGLLTTPQLHHIVRMANSPNKALHRRASEDGYYTMLADAFKAILHVRGAHVSRMSQPHPARAVLRPDV